MGQAYHALGDYRRAIKPLTVAVEFFSEDRLRQRTTGGGGFASIFSRVWLAGCLGELGETAAAQARVEDVVAIAERLGADVQPPAPLGARRALLGSRLRPAAMSAQRR